MCGIVVAVMKSETEHKIPAVSCFVIKNHLSTSSSRCCCSYVTAASATHACWK